MEGKTVNLVPERDGKIDDALPKVHMDPVDRAILNRTEMIKMASSLFAVLKK